MKAEGEGVVKGDGQPSGLGNWGKWGLPGVGTLKGKQVWRNGDPSAHLENSEFRDIQHV